jgi:omega-6 fatty acid desaturase (delta-12 desaturase)
MKNNKIQTVDTSVYPNGIPEALPEDITLNDIIKALPKEVFQKNMTKAWASVLLTLVSVSLSIMMIHTLPWFLVPLAWIVAGTAFTGFFVIGHDCGHLSFARAHVINDVVGTIMFLPLMYPFEPWRIQHNLHHNNTNKLHVDNAWQPFQPDYYDNASKFEQTVMRLIKGPLYYMASIGHMIKKHFFLEEFTETQLPRVKVSLFCVYAFGAIFFPTMWYYVGVTGILKYWFVPWLGYHFWMSTFTMVHHTLPHIPFKDESEWRDAEARLAMTVHCEYPTWIEYLCHHINVHIPHHVSTGIPSYNLRKAHEALKAKFGKHMHEAVFGYPLIRDIITHCHLYHEEKFYVPFTRNGDEDLKNDSGKKQK